MRAAANACQEPGFLVDNQALAALVLWASGQFDTHEICVLLNVREDAVCRTLAMARDGARNDRRASS